MRDAAVQLAPDVAVALVDGHRPDAGMLLRVRRAGAHLTPERARALRDWLDAVLDGATPPPADPDTIRVCVDEQRALLRGVSAEHDTNHDFRAGLAWADRALAAVAAAANQPSEVPA